MISEEEKEAIDYLQFCYDISTIEKESLPKLGIALNLIDKLQKVINLMAEEYNLSLNADALGICAECNFNNEDCHGDYCKETLIKYFYKKVEEENE